MTHILLRHRDVPDVHQLDVYVENGGYEGFKKAVREMSPDEVISTVKAAVIKGRGGAGFPAGIKWGFVPKTDGPKYVVINNDESETGTFKDRELVEFNPHQVIEGALIAAYAVGAQTIYCYFRGEYMDAAYHFEEAIKEARAANLIGENILGSEFSCEFYTHYGAGAYICGEETALLNSLMGLIGQPWAKPPFPAVEGLYQAPTVVNNVETLANVPPVLVNGPEWYTSMGSDQSPGIKVVCVSGHVRKPGNYEVEMHKTTYRELIYDMAGGIQGDRELKAILPSGGSGPMVTAEALDAPISFEGLQDYGSIMGSASVIVMDETTDMVWVAYKATHFFKHESCGKCTPCREGTYWLDKVLYRVAHGQGTEGDLAILESVAANMKGKCLCALGEFAISPVQSAIKHFLPEFKAAVQKAQQAAEPVPAD